MHIRPFIAGCHYGPPAPGKLEALLSALSAEFVAAPENWATTRFSTPDVAFDRYFARYLAPAAAALPPGAYPFACMINFGVHQLTMRRFHRQGNQIFVQVGAGHSEVFAAGIVRNVGVPCHLIAENGETVDEASLSRHLTLPWEGRPEFFRRTLSDYVSERAPRIGFLVIAGQGSAEGIVRVINAATPAFHENTDILVHDHVEELQRLLTMIDVVGHRPSEIFQIRLDPETPASHAVISLQVAPIDYGSIVAPDNR